MVCDGRHTGAFFYADEARLGAASVFPVGPRPISPYFGVAIFLVYGIPHTNMRIDDEEGREPARGTRSMGRI